MSKQKFDLYTDDGIKIHGAHWAIKKPKAVIALVHGLGEHAGRYDHFAKWFNAQGYAVLAYDRRGHGQSAGQRGHTPSIDAYLDEVGMLVNEAVKTYTGLPMFIYGHSQGGNLVLNFVIKRRPRVKGVVVTGPWIRLAFEPPKALVMLGKVMKVIYPKFNNKNQLDPSHVSRDPVVVKAYVDDPLVHDNISASTGLEMMAAAERLNTYDGEFPAPLLMMHGSEDKLISLDATKEFADRASGNIQLKVWEGFYHEVHNEPEKEEVFQYTLDWMEAKLNA